MGRRGDSEPKFTAAEVANPFPPQLSPAGRSRSRQGLAPNLPMQEPLPTSRSRVISQLYSMSHSPLHSLLLSALLSFRCSFLLCSSPFPVSLSCLLGERHVDMFNFEFAEYVKFLIDVFPFFTI